MPNYDAFHKLTIQIRNKELAEKEEIKKTIGFFLHTIDYYEFLSSYEDKGTYIFSYDDSSEPWRPFRRWEAEKLQEFLKSEFEKICGEVLTEKLFLKLKEFRRNGDCL
jgi:hypothetical protein